MLRGCLDARGWDCPFGISPGAFCSCHWQREELSPSAVAVVHGQSSLTSPRSSLRSSRVYSDPPSASSDPLPILSFQGTPAETPPSALGSQCASVAAALGPCGMQRGIWALIHEHFSKGSWKRTVGRCKSQAGWVAQQFRGDAQQCPRMQISIISVELWNNAR